MPSAPVLPVDPAAEPGRRRRPWPGLALSALALLPLLLLRDPIARPELCWPLVGLGGLAWWWSSVRARDLELSLATLLGGALLLRLVTFLAAPQTSDDILRYVWEALVVADGSSPYAFAPSARELAHLRASWPELYAGLNHPDTAAAYPPLYQAAASAVVALARVTGEPAELPARAIVLLRLFAMSCDLLVIWPLRRLLLAAGRNPSLTVVWAWSPLVALEFAGAGHMDVLGILAWTAALAALVRAGRERPARPSLGGLALLCAAVLVKYLPALSLPFALRVPRARALPAALACALLIALAFAPLLALRGGLGGLLVGLSDYGLRWESTSLVYRFVEAPLLALSGPAGERFDARLVGRGAVALAWIGLAILRWRRGSDLLRASWILLAAFLVLSPTLHPWYLTWTLPFLACFPSRAWSWLVAAAPLCYWMLARWQAEGLWQEPAWLWPLLALPFFGLLLADNLRRP